MQDTEDCRLLEPGWAGHLDIDELDYLRDRLEQIPRLAYTWGFRPSSRRRPEWALRQVAVHGDPDKRAANATLARRIIPDSSH